ncbi:MAG: hypothetical protein ACTS22_10160 [Phycisphaerales bacterium]
MCRYRTIPAWWGITALAIACPAPAALASPGAGPTVAAIRVSPSDLVEGPGRSATAGAAALLLLARRRPASRRPHGD